MRNFPPHVIEREREKVWLAPSGKQETFGRGVFAVACPRPEFDERRARS